MSKIEKAIKKQAKVFEKEIDRKITHSIKNKALRKWEGKKIVTIKEWEEMTFNLNFYKTLEYIPEDYVEYPFFYFPSNDKELPEKRKEWYKLYRKYLKENRKPGFGKKLCSDCILNPDSDLNCISVRDVVAKSSLQFEPNKKFPCDIVNIFKCPYKQEGDDKFLLTLGYMYKIVDDALDFAHSRSYYDNQQMFEADFERDQVELYISRLSTTPICTDSVERSIPGLKLSKVQVLWIEDIYKAITNKKILDVLLEQYIDSVANDYYYSKKKNIESEKRADEIRKFKDYIINVFMDIKDKIKLKDLQGIHGVTLEDEKEEKQRLDRVKKWMLREHPDKAAILNGPKHGKCTTCDGFANIHCTNCDIWVCDEHWRLHKDFHDKNKFLV